MARSKDIPVAVSVPGTQVLLFNYHSPWKKQLIPDVKRENTKWAWDNLLPKHKETLADQPDSVLKGLKSPTV